LIHPDICIPVSSLDHDIWLPPTPEYPIPKAPHVWELAEGVLEGGGQEGRGQEGSTCLCRSREGRRTEKRGKPGKGQGLKAADEGARKRR
jgi:hypothetical protein